MAVATVLAKEALPLLSRCLSQCDWGKKARCKHGDKSCRCLESVHALSPEQ
jgi:hypothetical protein